MDYLNTALLLVMIFVAILAAVGVLRTRVMYRREIEKLRQEIETLKAKS